MSQASFPTVALLRMLMRRKWIILIVAVVSAVGAYLYARTLPEYFRSTVNCVPPKSDNSLLGGALGGISSTLKDFGLTKLGGKGGDSYEFIVLLYSRTLRDSMISRFELAKEYELEGKPRMYVREELEKNLDINLHAEGNYEITFWSREPQKAVTMCTTFVSFANDLANRIQREEATKATSYLETRLHAMDSAMADLTDTLSAFSRRYGIFSPLDQAKASATGLSEIKANVLKQETLLGLLRQNYGPDDPQVRTQTALVQELKDQYQRVTTQPGFAGNFPITDAAGVGVRYMKVYTEFEAYAKVKAFLMPTLEQTRLDMQKNTPSLMVVDAPIVAEKKDRPKRSLIAAGAGVGGGIIMVLIFLAMYAWRSLQAPEQSA